MNEKRFLLLVSGIGIVAVLALLLAMWKVSQPVPIQPAVANEQSDKAPPNPPSNPETIDEPKATNAHTPPATIDNDKQILKGIFDAYASIRANSNAEQVAAMRALNERYKGPTYLIQGTVTSASRSPDGPFVIVCPSMPDGTINEDWMATIWMGKDVPLSLKKGQEVKLRAAFNSGVHYHPDSVGGGRKWGVVALDLEFDN